MSSVSAALSRAGALPAPSTQWCPFEARQREDLDSLSSASVAIAMSPARDYHLGELPAGCLLIVRSLSDSAALNAPTTLGSE